MKNKFTNFLSEKKDLLIFIGILALTFVSVVTIATIANKEDEPDTSVGGMVTNPTDSVTDNIPPKDDPTVPKPKYTFVAPIEGDYVIAREFFDLNNEETIASAVMSNGTTFKESTGISFAKNDNSIFDVLCSYPGEVVEVAGNDDSLEGYTVTIQIEEGLFTVYSSLSEVNVEVGDNVDIKQKIGVSGTSINDLDAKIHVHLQIVDNDTYINPKVAIGKEISEVVSAIK